MKNIKMLKNKPIYTIYIFLLSILFTYKNVYSNTNNNISNISTISNIKINNHSENATKARSNAILKGEKDAFYKLINRIIIDKNEKEIIEFPSEKKIDSMVYSIEIQNEKVISNNYSGVINITFDMDIVTKILKKQKISYIDESSDPILILPVLHKNNEITFWDTDNPFKQTWNEIANDSIIMSYIIPTGKENFEKNKLSGSNSVSSMEDIENILYQDYIIREGDIISQLKKIYKTDQVFLVEIRPYRNNNRNYFSTDIYLRKLMDKKTDKKVITYKGEENLPEKSLLLFSTRDISQKIEESWKEIHKNSFHKTLVYLTIFPIKDLNYWVEVNKELKTLSFLKNFKIKEIDTKKALVEMYFNIEYEEFIVKMKKNNFNIKDKDNYLFITYEK